MTTVINSPGNGEPSGSSAATSVLTIVVSVIVLIVVGALFFIYVMPAIRGSGAPQGGSIDVNLKLPPGTPAPAPTPNPAPAPALAP